MSKFSKVPLGKASLSIIDGDRGANYPKKTEFFAKGHCWFLNTSNVKSVGFDFGEMDFITAEKDAALSKGKLRRHDIVLTTRGTIGNCAYFGEDIPFENIRINSGMVVLRADPSQLNPYFLYAFLRSEIFKIQTGTHSSGSAQPQLPIVALRNIVIPLFELPHQRKIAAVLSALDAKIALNQRINLELEGLAKLLYDYWFVQYDFPLSAAQAAALGKPRLAGQPYRTSGGKMVYHDQLKREIPEGWEVENILAISELGGGATPSKKKAEFWNGKIPFFTPTDAQSEPFCLDTEDHITHEGLRNSSTRLYGAGALFITARSSVGKAMIISKEMAMNQSCYALIPREGVGRAFLYFHTMSLMGFLREKSSGSVFKSIVTNDIKFTPAIVPNSENLKEFSKFAEPVFNQILNNQEQNQELTALRDWLLPMLMNGQVRVG